MPKTSYICNCDVIHEDIVNDVKSKMQPKDDYIQLASLFKLFGDGTRVQILHALEQSEMCVCDLAVLLGGNKICNFASVKGITPCESGKIP